MTSRPRFPLGLTFAVAVVVAICTSLGVWQLQRAAWKSATLSRIEARQKSVPQPIGLVLARAANGEDERFVRVVADCAPAPPAKADHRMSTDRSEWVTRAQSICRLPGLAFDGIHVDRGFVEASRGSTEPVDVVLPAPAHIVGVLDPAIYACPPPPKPCAWRAGLARPAPYILVVDRETPPAPGVTPGPYPDPAQNLQYVGAYAPTWFGLAGVALCVYAAMLFRRYRPKALTSPA